MRMNVSLFKKTAMSTALAATFAGATIPAAEATVINVSFKAAFTMLAPVYGSVLTNTPSDYASGYYALPGPASGPATTYGWNGIRTPISGTMSFDVSSGAGVATVTPFLFFGNTSNNYAAAQGITFQHVLNSPGTLVGSMLFSWNQGSHDVSIVMDAAQMFAALPELALSGPSSSVSGTYSAVSNTAAGMTAAGQITTAIARTSTLNTAAGCDGLTLATQVNAYTINTNMANYLTCTDITNGYGTDDGVGGDPMTSPSFSDHNGNFDILEVHFISQCDVIGCNVSAVPIPAAAWLFGSGLLGLVGVARRRKKS